MVVGHYPWGALQAHRVMEKFLSTQFYSTRSWILTLLYISLKNCPIVRCSGIKVENRGASQNLRGNGE